MVAIGAAAIDNDIKILANADDFDPNEEDEFDSPANISLSTSPNISLTGEALRKAKANHTIDYDKSLTGISYLFQLGILANSHKNFDVQNLLALEDGKDLAAKTLEEQSFELSPTQTNTLGNGKFFSNPSDSTCNENFM